MSEHCDSMFRYTLDDSSGRLIFTEFKACERLAGTDMGNAIEEYFLGRDLCDVDADDVAVRPECKDCDCLGKIFKQVLELRDHVAQCDNKRTQQS